MKLPAFRIIVIIMVSAGWVGIHAQALEIHTPAFADKLITVTSFRALVSDTLFSSRLDKEGRAVVAMNKEGFILIELDGKQVYPMIFTAKENWFRLGVDGYPDFTGYPQNSFFLRHLLRRQDLLNQSRILQEALSTFAADDTLCAAFHNKQNGIAGELQRYDQLYADSSGYTGAVFISAKQLLESSYGIHTEDELVQKKLEFSQFIHNHYAVISSSDMLQQFANQYMMMNEYVLVGKEKMEDQVERDVHDWIDLLKGHIGKRETVQYFLNYYISRLMVTMTGVIYEKFPGLSACPVQHVMETAGKPVKSTVVNRIDSSMLEKMLPPEEHQKSVWVIMDVDCPASVAGQVLLNRFISEQKIAVDVITVFCGRMPGKGDYRMLPDVSNPVFCPDGITLIGDNHVMIKKYPAFILMNGNKQIESVDYTLAGIRQKLMKMKNIE